MNTQQLDNHLILETGSWSLLKEKASDVRQQVFVQEQQIAHEQEFDEMDQHCIHTVIYHQAGQAVATGRLLPDGHIGRMAVVKTFRSLGLGAKVLSSLIEAAKQRGDRQVILSAQTHAIGFYQKFGFQVHGQPYLDVGIEHIQMRLNLA